MSFRAFQFLLANVMGKLWKVRGIMLILSNSGSNKIFTSFDWWSCNFRDSEMGFGKIVQ
jgi:hypothetical protein